MPYKRKIPLMPTCGLHLFREVLNGKWKSDLIYYIYAGTNRPRGSGKKNTKGKQAHFRFSAKAAHCTWYNC